MRNSNLQFYLTCRSGTSESKSLETISREITHRLDDCCSKPVVLSCRDQLCRELINQKPMYKTQQKCHNRICKKPACVKSRYVRTTKNYLPKVEQMKRPRFMTLTIKEVMDLDFKSKERVDYAFKLLIQYLKRGRFVRRYVKALEVEKRDSGWFFHLHIIFEGRYIHKPKLSRKWEQFTGGSYIVDISEIRDRIKVGSYVTKYISKGSILNLSVDQFMLIRKMQFFATGGKFIKNFKKETYRFEKIYCGICGLRYLYDQLETESEDNQIH